MIVLLSPSKSQDFSPINGVPSSTPNAIKQSHLLINLLKNKSVEDLGKLMSISQKLSESTFADIQNFDLMSSPRISKQALFTYSGEVFKCLKPKSFNPKQLEFSHAHLRILSGLYGVLHPLDLIQPYRLPMATNLSTESGNNLNIFWKNEITNLLNQAENKIIINLASNEYFKTINQKKLKSKIITIQFKEKKNNAFKVIGFFAKQARGAMVHYLITHGINQPELLKNFNQDGYKFNPLLSQEFNWVFTRG